MVLCPYFILQETVKYAYISEKRLFFNLTKYKRKILYTIHSVLSKFQKQIMDDDSDPCSVTHKPHDLIECHFTSLNYLRVSVSLA